jgi:gliding motility-associated lipoprotein GldD
LLLAANMYLCGMYRFVVWLLLGVLAGVSCSQPSVTPRPHAYPRVFYPERGYQMFDTSFCSFRFEYPQYARIEQDTAFFNDKPESPCWFNVVLPAFAGKIHCSYKDLKKNKLNKCVDDTYRLAQKHDTKADYIGESYFSHPSKKVYATVFEIEGNAASPFQFYITDSTQHFLRGSLYFSTHPEADSMAPVIQYVKADIIHLINTFEWSK